MRLGSVCILPGLDGRTRGVVSQDVSPPSRSRTPQPTNLSALAPHVSVRVVSRHLVLHHLGHTHEVLVPLCGQDNRRHWLLLLWKEAQSFRYLTVILHI